jgi:glutathione S-transferase
MNECWKAGAPIANSIGRRYISAGMDFYFGPFSGNSARVAFALFEADIPFEPHFIHTARGDQRAPEYRAINPVGKVPAIVDGTLSLWESNAINWYLAEKHAESRLLPQSVEGRARIQKWLFFQIAHVWQACGAIFRATHPGYLKAWNRTADPAAAEAGRVELDRYLPVLEGALEDRDWLEKRFSLADITYAPHLWLAREAGASLAATPRVDAWLTRMVERPAWQKLQPMIFADPT